jgi:hypothetical protein
MISMTTARAIARAAVLPLALACAYSLPLSAQIPSASAPALGLADNYSALARGFNAVAWNPAMLGMPDNPRFSLGVLPVRGAVGIGPITLGDVAGYESRFLDDAVKQEWLRRIIENGGEKGTASGDITYLGMSVGRFAVQLSTMSHVVANLSPDAAELVLFGNAERSTGENFELGSSSLQGMITSTAAVSFAQTLPMRFLVPAVEQHLSVGVTVKYTVGNALVLGQNIGSVVSNTGGDIDVAFPIIQSDSVANRSSIDRGRGVGIDVGAAWRGGPLSLSASVRNLYNSFAWDTAGFVYRPGRVQFDGTTGDAQFDMEAYTNAPAELKDAVRRFTYARQISVGGAWRVNPKFLLSADVRQHVGTGMEVGPRSHVGVAAEVRPFSFLPLRAGYAQITGGYQLGAGAGVDLGPVSISASVGRRRGGFGEDTMAAFGLTFGDR